MRTDCNGLTAQVPTVFLQSDVHATDCNDVFLQSDAHLVGCHAPALPGKTVDRGLRCRVPATHVYIYTIVRTPGPQVQQERQPKNMARHAHTLLSLSLAKGRRTAHGIDDDNVCRLMNAPQHAPSSRWMRAE